MAIQRFGRTTLVLGLLAAGAAAQEPPVPVPPPADPSAQEGKPEQPDPPTAQPAPAPGPADEAGSLPAVVVTPTRSARDPFETPADVRLLDAGEAFGRRGARTVPEALGQLAGVGVQKTAQGQGTVFLRGLTGYHTLLLFDGMRLNNSIFRSGPNEYLALVDPSQIDRMELVGGPGAVLYGSDAVGGSLNLLSRRVERDAEPGWRRRLQWRYDSADRSHTARGEVEAWTADGLAIRVGATWRDFDELEGGRHVGTQQRTGFDALASDAAVEWQASGNTLLRATVFHTDLDDVWRTHKTAFGFSWHGTTVGSELARVLEYERAHGALHLEVGEAGCLRNIRVSVSGDHHLEVQDRTKSGGTRDLRFIRVNTAGAAAHATAPLWGEARLLFGADHYHDDVDSGRRDFAAGTGLLSSTKIQGSVADDARYDLLGAYLRAEVPIGARWELHAGARFTWADFYAGAVEDPVTKAEIALDDTFTNLSGSGQLLFRPADHLRLHTALAQSFRAPNLSDLTRLDTARSGEREIPSPGLDPERYLTWEIGVKERLGGFGLEAVYSYTWITDMILRTPTGNLVGTDLEVRKTNVGDGYLQAASGTVRYLFQTGFLTGWLAEAGATWQEGSVDTFPTSAPVRVREPLSKLPPASGFVRMGFESNDGLWHVEAEARFARSQERLSTADARDTQRIPPGGTPGWAVFALRGGVALADALRVHVGIENLGDRDYRLHGSGVNEAGLHVVLQVAWEF